MTDSTATTTATTTASSDSDAAATPPELRHGAPVSRSRGQVVVHPSREQYAKVVAAFKAEGFETCSDLCAVDFRGVAQERPLPVGVAPGRYEVVVNLLSLSRRERVRVRVQLPDADPRVASLYDLYPGVEAMEREAYDLMGVTFDGHPDLTRILMPDDWVGHPLRKEEPMGRIPVQFKGAPPPR
jgi:NADH-quinone oxidoreductase subunit C